MENVSDPYRPLEASLDGPISAPAGSTAPSDAVVQLLAQTRPWVRLMAIFAFGVIGLFVVLVVLMGVIGHRIGSGKIAAPAFIPLLGFMLLYLPPALFLWSYAASIKRLLAGGGQTALESALRNQKSFWKYVGILSSVMMVFYGIAFAIAAASGVWFKP
jgi:hypothetical protein